jgi:xylan 1,4-beta-xylosidase
MSYTNPVIPGFHPDPSVCRVGEEYYLATSSFEYFPGVPIFHSRDLVNWRQIGYCLMRESQLPLRDVMSSGGIWAPTLRYHAGRFYMITSNMPHYRHFYVSADDPAGEWSEPIRIDGDSAGSGFDTDLFFDDGEADGKVYMARHSDDTVGIRLWELDLATGTLLGPEHLIWPGFEDDLCEAPHLYKIDGLYYRLLAEGSTHRGHMATIGRSDKVTGPYESCPYNPILTHRAKVAEPIQAIGHADLVQAHDGSWWAVFLGIRQNDWRYHHLGRETFLAPVTWTADGWPIITDRQHAVQLQVDGPALPQHPWPAPAVRDDFDAPKLALLWNFRKNPDPQAWSLSERPGWLTLRGTPPALSDFDPPIFVGRRQQHFECTAATLLEFEPGEGDEAGLTAFMNEQHHYEVALSRQAGGKFVIVRRRIGDLSSVVAIENAPEGPLVLQIVAEREKYTLGYSCAGQPFKPLTQGLTKYLSSEVAGGFTGVYFALYATGHGKHSTSPACFDWFDYDHR